MKTMEPREKRSCMWSLASIAMFLFLPCFAWGIIFIDNSVHYLDCDRSSGQVNCAITTRFLGTFTTEKRTASGVTAAVEVEEKCGEASCPARIELITPSGPEPLSNGFSPDPKPKVVERINTYLVDPDQPTLHLRVVDWRVFINTGLPILVGGAGLVGMLLWMKRVGKVKTEWRDIVGERKSEVPAPGTGLPVKDDSEPPPGMHIEREITRLSIRYRYPPRHGLVFIEISLIVVVMSLAPFETFIVWFLYFAALVLAYTGLATLVNQWIIEVTYDELRVRYTPLPYFHRSRTIPSGEIKQMYVAPREVNSRHGSYTYYLFVAILQDNRRVLLISELPHNMLCFIEAEIERWLKIEDRWVEGEARQEEVGDADELTYIKVTERIGIKTAHESPPGLTHPEQVIYRIHKLARHVVQRDFQGYFSSQEADDVLEAVAAFDETGACQTADVVRRAMAIFPGGAPASDVEQRRSQLKAMSEAQRETLGELSGQFQEVEDGEFYRIEEYIHKHRADLAGGQS